MRRSVQNYVRQWCSGKH